MDPTVTLSSASLMERSVRRARPRSSSTSRGVFSWRRRLKSGWAEYPHDVRDESSKLLEVAGRQVVGLQADPRAVQAEVAQQVREHGHGVLGELLPDRQRLVGAQRQRTVDASMSTA